MSKVVKLRSNYDTHHMHSHVVRGWNAKQQMNAFGVEWREGKAHTLKSPHEGYVISVTFRKYPKHPEYTRVRSVNWRCEHEPNGVYLTTDARMFYRKLKDAGFVEG